MGKIWRVRKIISCGSYNELSVKWNMNLSGAVVQMYVEDEIRSEKYWKMNLKNSWRCYHVHAHVYLFVSGG